MAGDVHGRIIAVDHTRAQLHELVDDLVDLVLVARDQGAGQNHRVEFVDGDIAVVAVGDTAQGGHRLALGAGAHVDELVVLHIMGLLQVDDGVFRQTQVAQIGCDGHVAHHGTADEHNLAAVLVSGVDDLLHAMHVAGEAGHDDLAGRLRERLVKGRTDGGLRLDEARHLGVGGVHHQKVHALLAELAEFHQIGDAMVKRQLVEFDIAGVDQGTGRSLHEYGQSVRDGVGHVHEFKVVWAHLELVAALDLDKRRIDVVLLALGLREGQCELGTDQWNVRAQFQQVRYATDVVLMTVGEHQSLDLVETILDVVEVRQYQVHARLLLFRKQHTAVDEQQVAIVFDHVHIAADLTQTAQRHDAHGALAVLWRGDQHGILLRCGGLRCRTGGTAIARGTGASAFAAAGAVGITSAAGRLARGCALLLRRGISALDSPAAALVRCLFLGFFCSHFLVGFLLLIVPAYAGTRNEGARIYCGLERR